MAIEAELADGRILEFPDGTNPAVIQATVKKLMGQSTPPAQAPAAPVATDSTPYPEDAGVDALGNMYAPTAASEVQPKPKFASVLNNPKVAAPAPIGDKMLNPDFVSSIQAKLDSMPEEERLLSLNRMAARPDVYGRAAKAIGAKYAALDQTQTPTLRKTDPRLEAQTERFIDQGRPPELAKLDAQQQALSGQLQPAYAQMTEAPVEYAEAEDYRTKKNLTGIEETGQALTRGGKKALLGGEQGVRGVNQFVGDVFDFDMSTNKARLDSIDRFSAAMGEQSSKPLNLIEGAITSIGQQIPALIGGALTGSEGLVLTNMFAQSFGQTYDEGKRRGLDTADNATRSAMYAALEAVGEKFGLGDRIKGLKAAANGLPSDKIAKFFAKSLVKEVPGEELTYAGQFAVDKGYGMNPEAGLADFFSGAADTALSTVIQGGMMTGAGVVAGKGVNKAQELRDKIQASQRDGYAKDTSYEGLSSLIAQSKGFLTPEAKAQEPTKPIEAAANVASPEVEEVASEAPIADRDTRIKELAERIAKTTGATEGDSLRVATQRIEREEAQNEQVTTEVGADTGAAAEGSNALGEPIGGADRAGVSVAEQPQEVSTAQGTEGAQPGAVVPAGSATDGTAVGAGQQPGALTAEEELSKKSLAESDSTPRDELRAKIKKGASTPGPTYTSTRSETNTDSEGNEVTTPINEDYKVVRMDDGWTTVSRPDGSELTLYPPSWAAAHTDEQLIEQKYNPEYVKDLVVTPTETKGTTTDGNETPETVEAETQGQETSAAAAELNKPKRGRPAKVLSTEEQAATAVKATKQKGRPSLTLTPEQIATRDKERKDKRAVYMKVGRAIDKLAPKLNSAILGGERDTKRKLLKQILELEPSVRGTPVGAKIKAALANPRITPEEIASVKREIAEEQGKLLPSVSDSSSPSDSKFNKFTNGVQALGHIIKTGNPFQQMLGKRLRGFVNGVKFVVLETDSPVPKSLQGDSSDQWTTAHAIYVPREKAIYVKGKSFGKMRGTSNSTVLHELLHAATSMKLRLGQRALDIGYDQNNAVTQVTKDLLMVMNNAKQRFDEMKAAGTLPEHIEKIGKAGGGFTNVEEFLAYGMSDKAMQEFLMGTKSIGANKSFFSRFVHDIARFFNIGAKDENALLDLIAGTDKLLTARKSASMRYVEAEANKQFGAQAANVTEEEDGEGEVEGEETPTTDTVIDKAKEAAAAQNKKVIGALKTVAMSRNGQGLGEAVSALAALRSPTAVWNELKYVWNDLSDGARSAISQAYDADAIANSGVGDVIPALKDTNRIFHHMSGMTQSLLRGTADQSESLVRFYRAHPDQKTAFEDLIYTSTLAEYDPSNAKNKTRNATLDAMYSALPEQGKAAYKNLRDYYSAMNDLQASIVTQQLDNLDIPDDERTKLIKGIREVYEAANKIQPYFPLMRHGDFVLEYGGTKNRVSLRFDTKAQQQRAADAYAKSKGKTALQMKQDGSLKTYEDARGVKLRNYVEANSILLKTIYSAVDAAPLADPAMDPTKVRNEIKDQVYQAYLVAMPEQSVRKMFMHRKGTAGFSTDVLRDLNAYGSRAAKYYSKLRYGTEIRNSLEAAERGLVGNEKYKPFVDRMTEMVADYLQPAQQTGIGQAATTAADVITKVSFVRNLTSWSSASLQPMDIIMKGAPILSGNHGPKAIAELSKTMKVWNTMGTVQHNADGTTSWRAPSIEFAEGLTPEQRRAVRQMVTLYGVTTDTLANEVYSRARKPATKVDSKTWAVTKDIASNAIMGGLMHHGERISREVLFLASYNLYRQEGVPFDEAIEKAVNEVNEALGNYSPYGKPMLMRGAGGRLATMYKFFPLVTTRQLVGNFFRMLPMFNKEGKAAAATKFFGIMGTHLLLGGVRSLPMFSVVMSMLGAAWAHWGKDPDAPDEMKDVDYETWWLTEYIPSMLGDTKLGDLTQLAENGVLNALTGWDIASRISLNDIWFREPTPGKTIKESMMNWGWVAGGAAAQTALDIATGVSLLKNGDYEKGFEKLVPGSISKLMMANRFANEGIEDSRGATLVEPGKLSKSELAGQAVGFRPAELAAAQTTAFKATATQTAIVNEKRNLSNQLVDSFRKANNFKESDEYRERFDKKFEKTLEKIGDYSGRNPEQEFTDAEIENLLENALDKKARTESGSGIALDDKNARLLGPASEFTEKTLSEYNDRK